MLRKSFLKLLRIRGLSNTPAMKTVNSISELITPLQNRLKVYVKKENIAVKSSNLQVLPNKKMRKTWINQILKKSLVENVLKDKNSKI